MDKHAAGVIIKYHGVTPEVSSYIYQIAVTSILSYGCSSIHLSKLDVNVLDRTQSKHIKNMLGLSFSSHTTPLLLHHSRYARCLELV